MKDPIIEELWRVKDQVAEECAGDLNKLVARLREREKQQLQVVNFSKSGHIKKSTP